MKSMTGNEGSEITLTPKAFTRTGYTFAEWNTSEDGSGKVYEDKDKIKLTANTTLYAQWKANTYTVKFDANGGSGDIPADISATYDKEFELPENTFEKIGYNFAGWNTKTDGKGTNYEANTKVKNLTAENGATVTLYAQWANRGTHNINYVLNDGKHIDSPTTSFKETEDVTLGTAERTGYTFGGWYEAEDFSGTAVTSWKSGEKTEDVTLYAKWDANTYKVKFDKNADDATGEAPEEIKATYDKEFALPENTFTKIGYNFAGWNTKTDGKGTNYKANANARNLTEENNATVTLYAKWEAITYTITYELDGGTNAPDNPKSYTIETVTVTLKEPTKDGYTFDGWYTDNKFENKITEFKKGSTGKMTLYAKWELIITAENICNVIAELPEGRHTISVTGEIPESKFTEIKDAINANINAKVNLDLSGVTGLSTIPSNAFSYCGNLVGIVIPETESGIKLGKEAFSGCSGLENIYLPKNIYMDDHEYVFSDCSSLSQVSFGGTMEEFADSSNYSFYEYPDIFKAAITFSDGNSWTMGKDIRDSAEENPEISYSGEWNDIIEYMLRKTLDYSSKRVNLLDLSKMTGLTEISSSTDLYLLNVVKLILPLCATKVCEGTFNYSKIESIVIPGNIKTIEDKAFGNSGVANSSLSNVEIGYGVESIGSYAFASCSALKNVKIPASVKNLAANVFFNCGALETAIIEASGTIGDNAFLNCKALKKVTLGPNVTGIGEYAFDSCISLSEITIPASVTSIGEWVFYQVPATSINYSGTMEQWSKIEKDNAFVDSSIKTIKCSDGDITLE